MSDVSASSTRRRTRPSDSPPTAASTADNLPPPRRTEGLRTGVSLPLQNTRLARLIYLLVTLTTLLTAFYAYRAVQYKREIGGWWNLVLGRTPSGHHFGASGSPQAYGGTQSPEDSVEEKINALATALGMPSKELASAIALAVRNYVPPASLSSVAAKETGTVVQVLVQGKGEGSKDVYATTASPTPSQGVFDGVVYGFDNFVGLEEP